MSDDKFPDKKKPDEPKGPPKDKKDNEAPENKKDDKSPKGDKQPEQEDDQEAPQKPQQPQLIQQSPLAAAAIKTLRQLVDRLDTRRAAEALEGEAEASQQAEDTGMDAESMPDYKGEEIYVSFDGDDLGNAVARAEEKNDEASLAEISMRINAGNDLFIDWITAHRGKVIQTGGDEGCGRVNSNALVDLEDFRRKYVSETGTTVTVGVGSGISESTKARMLGKLRGKDQVCYFDDSTEAELMMRIEDGDGNGEAQKMRAAGLMPAKADEPRPTASQTGVDAPVEDGGTQRTSANQNDPETSPDNGEGKEESVQSGPDKVGGDEEPEDTDTPIQPGELPDELFDNRHERGRQAEMDTINAENGEGEFVREAPEETEEYADPNPDLNTFGDSPDNTMAEDHDTTPSTEGDGAQPEQDQEQPASAGPGPDEGGDDEWEYTHPDELEGIAPEGYAPADPESQEVTGPEVGDVGGQHPEWAVDQSGDTVPDEFSDEANGDLDGEGQGVSSDVGPPEDPDERNNYRKQLGRQIAPALRNMMGSRR
jgi:hypothetical protein